MSPLLRGIDVSAWQDGIDWAQAAGDDVHYVWVKATEGTGFDDPHFAENVTGARAVGLPVGGYHFAHLANAPEAEADHYRSVAGRLDLPMALDVENQSGWLPDPAANTDWCLRFFDRAGEPRRLLYTNGDGATSRLDSRRLADGGVMLWYANPGATDLAGVAGWSAATVVQCGYRAVAGIAGDVDADLLEDVTLAAWLQQPVPAPAPTPGPAPLPEGDDMDEHGLIEAIRSLYAIAGNTDAAGQLGWARDILGKPRSDWAGSLAFVASLLHG